MNFRITTTRENGPFMSIVADVLVGLVALLHGYFLVLEMFLWDKPAGLKAFGQTLEQAQASKVLAANQGLYNGFLSAGLIWGIWLGAAGLSIKVFLHGNKSRLHSSICQNKKIVN